MDDFFKKVPGRANGFLFGNRNVPVVVPQGLENFTQMNMDDDEVMMVCERLEVPHYHRKNMEGHLECTMPDPIDLGGSHGW